MEPEDLRVPGIEGLNPVRVPLTLQGLPPVDGNNAGEILNAMALVRGVAGRPVEVVLSEGGQKITTLE